MFHPEALQPLVVLVAIAVGVVIIYYLIRWLRHTLGSLGLSPGEIAVIIWATLVGSLINIPLVPFGDGFLGINVGGAVVPIVLSVYLIRRKGLPFNEVLVGVILVAFVSYLVTDYDPDIGVYAEFPWWLLPPFTAFLVAAFAYWHERPNSAALAYVSGTLGTLIGADIVRLPEILAGPPPEAVNGQAPILSIGGAGVFDMVFLAGILAVTMETGLLARTRENLVTQWGHNPIDSEYEEWVRRKAQEAEENRRKYREIEQQRREDPRTFARRLTREQTGPGPTPQGARPSRQDRPTPVPSRAGTSGTPPGTGTRAGSRYQSRYRPRYRRTGTTGSRYQHTPDHQRRFTPTHYTPEHEKRRAKERTQDRRTPEEGARSTGSRGTRGSRPRDEPQRSRTRSAPASSTSGEADDEPRPHEGPRSPARQPRPANGTKRIPASHRARGLYK